MKTNRRTLIKNGAALLPIPFLKSYASDKKTSNDIPAKRIIFLATGWGVTAENWFPELSEHGPWESLPKALKPLEEFKNDFSLIRNCFHKHSKGAHEGSTFWLTGADKHAKAGRKFHNTVSVDQIIASEFGSETRFKSLQISSGASTNRLSWNVDGKPLSSLRSPMELYQKLFESSSQSYSELKAQLNHQKSLLDIFRTQTQRISQNLNKADNEKLNEYLQSIRDIEISISKEESWLTIPKKRPANMPAKPKETLDGPTQLKSTLDLMVAAMLVDACRVFTYALPITSMLRYFGTSISDHNMSHYHQSQERREISEKRDAEYIKALHYLITKLKSTKEADGSSLFDNTVVILGSNIKSGHSLKDCTTLVTGGAAGIRLGEHLVTKEKTPLCNVWLTLIQGMGVKANSFGDSTGVLEGIKI